MLCEFLAVNGCKCCRVKRTTPRHAVIVAEEGTEEEIEEEETRREELHEFPGFENSETCILQEVSVDSLGQYVPKRSNNNSTKVVSNSIKKKKKISRKSTTSCGSRKSSRLTKVNENKNNNLANCAACSITNSQSVQNQIWPER